MDSKIDAKKSAIKFAARELLKTNYFIKRSHINRLTIFMLFCFSLDNETKATENVKCELKKGPQQHEKRDEDKGKI